MTSAFRWIATSLLLIASLGACGDDSGDGGTENAATGDSADSTAGGNGAPPAANCASRCATVAADCGAPAEVATGACSDICGMNPTEEQMTCLEGSDCNELTLLIAGDPVCGIGGGNTTNTTNASNSGPATTTTTTTTTDNPDTSTPGGTLGDPCDCGNPTVMCEGTENGCQFSFSGESYVCLVNSGDVSTGVCTQTCDPDNDMCAEGSCGPETNYLLGDTFYVCG